MILISKDSIAVGKKKSLEGHEVRWDKNQQPQRVGDKTKFIIEDHLSSLLVKQNCSFNSVNALPTLSSNTILLCLVAILTSLKACFKITTIYFK